MTALTSHARIAVPDPEAVIVAVCDHMTEHEAELVRDGDAHLLQFVEFAGDEEPQISWRGAGEEISRPPNFQIMQVDAVTNVTPLMRRIRLRGEKVERFLPLDALHLNILVQRPDIAEPQWPVVGASGMIQWPDPELRPCFRKYTVRSVDVAAGTMDLDFVIHDDAGPGSSLARTIRPGDVLGIAGPGGGGLAEADWYLFAGDETALPAIARMLENLPEHARGHALIEVADAAEVQELRKPAGIAIKWLFRDRVAAGFARLLPPAIEQIGFPQGGETVYVWAGCEFDDFRAIRKHVREERKLKKHEHLVVSYWRRGIKSD